MKSGVDPSALVSQLATLITDILAGKNKSTDVHHLHHGKIFFKNFSLCIHLTKNLYIKWDEDYIWL